MALGQKNRPLPPSGRNLGDSFPRGLGTPLGVSPDEDPGTPPFRPDLRTPAVTPSLCPVRGRRGR